MRALAMLYGVTSYFLFFGVFLYLIAFVGGVFVPNSLSTTANVETSNALFINLGLILMWGVQHSVMARKSFKDAIASIIPQQIERSTYVLASSIVLAVLMYYWQPMNGIVWTVESPLAQQMLWVCFGLGWALVLASTFLTDHFDLFGLRQTWLYFVKKSYTPVKFTQRLFYRWIRHPMMLGLIIAFWAIPTMTTSHFVFSAGMSIYVLIGIYFEEKGLARTIGSDYQQYQNRTSKVIPAIY